MNIPSLNDAETNLRHCLLLKADDLYFTLAAPHGEALRNAFLGISVEGLADENLSDEDIASIDLERFGIVQRIRDLHAMLDGGRLSLNHEHRPDVEDGRIYTLEFLEHFLSTLPNVALGGIDRTGARNREVRQIYNLAYAWLNLIETIEAAFDGETDSTLAVNDLALLSGLDTRTVRNHCGPRKLIRTSTTRTAQVRKPASAAFVRLNALDAVDWLKARKAFEISKIDADWIARQLSGATPAQATRGLLVAGIVNLGTIASWGPSIGLSPEQARARFDQGGSLPPDVTLSLKSRLGIES